MSDSSDEKSWTRFQSKILSILDSNPLSIVNVSGENSNGTLAVAVSLSLSSESVSESELSDAKSATPSVAAQPGPGTDMTTAIPSEWQWDASHIDILKHECIRRGKLIGQRISDAGNNTASLFEDGTFERMTSEFQEMFELLDHAAAALDTDHGLFHWQLTQKPQQDDDSATAASADSQPAAAASVEMNIDVVTASGKSLATVQCMDCEKVIAAGTNGEPGEVRYLCLECGPDHMYQCEDCYNTKRHTHMMSRDCTHPVHMMTSIAAPTVAASLCNALRTFSNRPFLGTRCANNTGGAYEWVTYSTVRKQVLCVAGELKRWIHEQKLNHCTRQRPQHLFSPLDHVQTHAVDSGRTVAGICGRNSTKWVVADFACAAAGVVSVGLHVTFSVQELAAIFERTQMSVVFADSEFAPLVLAATRSNSTTTVRIVAFMGTSDEYCAIKSNDAVSIPDAVLFEHITLPDKTTTPDTADHIEQHDVIWDTSQVSELIAKAAISTSNDVGPQEVIARKKCRECKSSFTSHSLQICHGCLDKENVRAQPDVIAFLDRQEQSRQQQYAILNDHINSTLPAHPQDLFTLILTSGTSGAPKLVIETDSKWNSDILVPNTIHPLVQPSYIPLSHSSDRLRIWESCCSGGRVGFCRYGSDGAGIDDLLEDIRMLRPTVLLAPPRIWNDVYARFLRFVRDQRPAQHVPSADTFDDFALSLVVDFLEGDQGLGGCLRAVNTGAAPTPHDVMKFMHSWHMHIAMAVSEGYGTSECGGIAVSVADVDGFTGMKPMQTTQFRLRTDGTMQRYTTYPQFKLVDVPELGYTKKDLPHPRGELHISSSCMTQGYYGDAAKTTAAFDTESGLYATGDICEIENYTEDNPSANDLQQYVIRIIDRRSNVFKLAMGEKFSPSRLETLFSDVHGVKDICVHGEPSENFVLAIVIVDTDILHDFCQQQGVEMKTLQNSLSHYCKDSTQSMDVKDVEALSQFGKACHALRTEIHTRMVHVARSNNLLQFEIPHGIWLDCIEWNAFTNGIRNTSAKLNRRRFASFYRIAIDQMYSDLRTSIPNIPLLQR
jgi:long-subunit acyl-CoA synthetase (AMP-forming)